MSVIEKVFLKSRIIEERYRLFGGISKRFIVDVIFNLEFKI